MSIFYETYKDFKGYETPSLKPKRMRDFDREIWDRAKCLTNMRFLEVGCGTGQVLAYLKLKGASDVTGIDQDPALVEFIPEVARDAFKAIDIDGFLKDSDKEAKFDRIFLFDVLEHFTHTDGHALLEKLSGLLAPGGGILLKMPNMSSPWGAQHQFGDLTHIAAYTPVSTRQMAVSIGMTCTWCGANVQGSPLRRILDPMLHGILSKILMSPPEVWTANFYAYVEFPD
ncbi:MAG: class I SAM-dependent methyltransferase [Rhodospirillales bacterium]|jgi:2-polyprenyl-3-methyl-5-hydroxy-6-metoxy-1,4-benzoquinol methylase